MKLLLLCSYLCVHGELIERGKVAAVDVLGEILAHAQIIHLLDAEN